MIRAPALFRPLAALALLGAVGAGAGCSSAAEQHQLTESNLRARLNEFTNHFSSAVQRAADEVNAGTPSLAIRNSMLRWQMFMIPACRSAAAGVQPLEAYVDVWTLCVQQELFFEGMKAKAQAADERLVSEVGLRTSSLLVQEAESIGDGFLTPEQMVEARDDVDDFAHNNPIDSRYTRLARLPSSVPDSGKGGDFGWVDRIPLINAFSGLDTGAKAIAHLADVAENFTRIAEQLPETMRWQTQLVLYDVDGLQSVQQITAAATSLAASADRIATVSEALPENTRQIVRESFAELEASQAPLQKTVEQARAAVAEARETVVALDGTVARTEQLLASLDGAAASVTRAGEAWEAMVRSLHEDDGSADATGSTAADPAPAPHAVRTAESTADATAASGSDGGGSDGGFDPVVYGDAAERVTQTAVEIRGLVQEVRDMLRSGDLSRPLDDADARARSLVDHATVRGLELIGAVFVAALLFRWLGRRRPAA